MEPSATSSISSALIPDDPSFSSYLRPEPNREPEKHPKTADQDAEISIFDAKKYFSESTDNQRIFQCNNQQSTPRFSSASSADNYKPNYRTRSFGATPTVSSEASWNSQTGLLSKPPGTISISLKPPLTSLKDTKTRPSSTSRRFFGRKCPCSDKKSVQVNENAFSDQKTTPSKKVTSTPNSIQNHTDPKTTPNSICNHPKLNKPENPKTTLVTLTREWEAKLKQDAPVSVSSHRISSEPRFPQKPIEPAGFSFPILNQNQNQTKPHIPKSPLSRRNSLDIYKPKTATLDEECNDDVASDGSSDLFEIESISTQTTTTSSYPLYQFRNRDSIGSRRHSLDDVMETCYAPSEVSVDWSVNTVEPFDRTVCVRPQRDAKRCSSNGGLLLSCRCEKAVSSVGPKQIANGDNKARRI